MSNGTALIAALLTALLVWLIVIRDELRKGRKHLGTGLSGLQAAVAGLTAKVTAVDADVKKLLANSTPGPGPGQVIVNQADIDSLTASVGAATGVLAADDTAANPPAPSPTT